MLDVSMLPSRLYLFMRRDPSLPRRTPCRVCRVHGRALCSVLGVEVSINQSIGITCGSAGVRRGAPGSAGVRQGPPGSAGVRRGLTLRTSVPSHPRIKAYGLGVRRCFDLRARYSYRFKPASSHPSCAVKRSTNANILFRLPAIPISRIREKRLHQNAARKMCLRN